MLTRRTLLVTAGAAAAAGAVARPWIVRAAAPFPQPPLPYPENALAPTIGAETVGLHYGKHHAAYFRTLNDLVGGTRYAGMTLEQVVQESAKSEADRKIFNNAGQAWNHILYWDQFKPGGSKSPGGRLKERIDADLGGLDKLKADMVKTAGDVFGSGWAWLVEDGGRLSLAGTPGGDSPFARGKTTLLGIDVWEHAYYLDYQNRRADHVKAVLDTIVNWDAVASRMKG